MQTFKDGFIINMEHDTWEKTTVLQTDAATKLQGNHRTMFKHGEQEHKFY